MVLYRVATTPEDIDEGADALVESSDDNLMHLSPTISLKGKNSSNERSPYAAPFLVPAEPPADLNKNTNWFSYPGIWSMYFIIVMLTWTMVLGALSCSVATAWVIVNTMHFLITFYLFHWKKGSPFPAEDQGCYGNLTWWEQMDSGRQLTRNRKFLTLVPVVLFMVVTLATRDHPHSSSLMFLNTVIVFTLVIAKLPMLHKIRILGINS